MSALLKDHRFYQKTPKERFKFFVQLGLISFLFILIVGLLSYATQLYFLGIFLLAIYLTIVAPFIDVPSLQKSGRLIYYAPLFMGEKEKKERITIHGGTLFDYYFVLNKNASSKQRTQYILVQYLEGLLRLLASVEDPINTPKTIQGTSYFLTQKTAERLGFQQVPTHGVQKIILVFNYFNILCSQSLVKGKLTFPNLMKISSFETTTAILKNNKGQIQNLIDKLT